jgi:hypothetical protein
MKKKCIVSWSSVGRENYPAAQLRLIKSCVNAGWDGDYIIQSLDGYCDNYMGVPIELGRYPQSVKYPLHNNHAEIPYGFKPVLIQEALEKGYEQIIWCDSTVRLAKHPQALLNLASDRGVVAFDNLGHPLKNWISDIALQMLEISEEQLQEIKQIMACVIIFDLSNPVGLKIFTEWVDRSRDSFSFQNGYGSNRPGFVAHRHDQAVLSGILWKNNIELLPYGTLVYPPHDRTGEYGNDFYFINKGVN